MFIAKASVIKEYGLSSALFIPPGGLFFFQTMLKWRMDALPCVVMRFVANAHAPCVNTITSLSPFHLQSDGDSTSGHNIIHHAMGVF